VHQQQGFPQAFQIPQAFRLVVPAIQLAAQQVPLQRAFLLAALRVFLSPVHPSLAVFPEPGQLNPRPLLFLHLLQAHRVSKASKRRPSHRVRVPSRAYR
jgi:hypothetical protein